MLRQKSLRQWFQRLRRVLIGLCEHLQKRRHGAHLSVLLKYHRLRQARSGNLTGRFVNNQCLCALDNAEVQRMIWVFLDGVVIERLWRRPQASDSEWRKDMQPEDAHGRPFGGRPLSFKAALI